MSGIVGKQNTKNAPILHVARPVTRWIYFLLIPQKHLKRGMPANCNHWNRHATPYTHYLIMIKSMWLLHYAWSLFYTGTYRESFKHSKKDLLHGRVNRAQHSLDKVEASTWRHLSLSSVLALNLFVCFLDSFLCFCIQTSQAGSSSNRGTDYMPLLRPGSKATT